MSIESRLQDLGLELPPPPPPGGVYKPVVVTGNYLYVSGQVPVRMDGTLITGTVGVDLTLEQGQAAARQACLTMLATIKAQIGDLGTIARLIKTFGMVNCLPEYTEQPKVINGFSMLMRDVLGEENGVGARSAVGNSLPSNVACEVEAIFELG